MNARLPRMAVLTAFASLLAVAASAQTGGSAAPTPQAGLDDPWSAVEPDFSNHEDRPLQRRSADSTSPVLAGNNEGRGYSWARTLGALAGVTGLIVLLAWGYRAMAGGGLPLLGKAKRPGLIEVVSRTSLSARQSLCLVRVGSRLVLIGQSQDNLRALDVIDDADLAARLAGEAAGKRPDSSRNEFRNCLEREAAGYQERAEDIEENVTPDGRRIAEVQEKVTEAIRRVGRAVRRG